MNENNCISSLYKPKSHIVSENQQYTILNHTNSSTYPSEEWSCDPEKKCFVSDDPRLYNPIRNQRLCLNNPPYTSNKDNMSDVKDLYMDYRDINEGQIIYYKRNKNPFENPTFDETNVSSFVYTDPMNQNKPIYIKHPTDDFGCLSWLNDTTNHREDLMSRQMTNMLNTDYQVFYRK